MMNLSSVRIFLSENNGLDCDSVSFFLINISKKNGIHDFIIKNRVWLLYRRPDISALIVYINVTNKIFYIFNNIEITQKMKIILPLSSVLAVKEAACRY